MNTYPVNDFPVESEQEKTERTTRKDGNPRLPFLPRTICTAVRSIRFFDLFGKETRDKKTSLITIKRSKPKISPCRMIPDKLGRKDFFV